jgi:hypothetical protein
MSEAAESIDELADRRRQQDASEVFMYTFAAVGALTVAEMDAAHAAVPGAPAPATAHGPSHSPPAPGLRPVTDSAFGAAISALTLPFGESSEAPTPSASSRSDVGALTATAGETLLSYSPDAVGPMFAAPVSAASLENPFASLLGSGAVLDNASTLAVYEARTAQLGAGDPQQALGAYQMLSPEVASASITLGLGETATLRSFALDVAVRG